MRALAAKSLRLGWGKLGGKESWAFGLGSELGSLCEVRLAFELSECVFVSRELELPKELLQEWLPCSEF